MIDHCRISFKWSLGFLFLPRLHSDKEDADGERAAMVTSDDSDRQFGTLASAVTDELRTEIIAGVYRPGEKLRVRQLATRFGVGLSPIREALNRLSRDRLVMQNDLRGFAVAGVGLRELEELLLARCWLNERALRESVARGGNEWEDRIVISFHRLTRVPRFAEGTAIVDRKWDAAHRDFHRALISACGSQWIVDYCDQLFDVADLYRHVARTAPAAADRLRDDEHKRIMDAALQRDADTACRELLEHFHRTADLFRQALEQSGGEQQKRRRLGARDDAGGGR